MNRIELNKAILIFSAVLISIIFLYMIRQFIVVILLAGIFTGITQPVQKRFETYFKGRKGPASFMTMAFIFFAIFLPLVVILVMVAGQAITISEAVPLWLEQWMNQSSTLNESIQSLPFHDVLIKYNNFIFEKAGELVDQVGRMLFKNLSALTLSTINFIFLFFVFLYTLFFFLKDGDLILEKISLYLPITDSHKERLVERLISVTRATIRGTLVIGVIQGGLAGLAFWVAGIENAVFWGMIMTVLSVIPMVGSALIWFPAVIILAVSGYFVKALALLIFCAVLVGSVDNLLRPTLVGRDTQLHELFIFFGTLGGLSLFGIVGFIVGPVIAGIFVSLWSIYAETFREQLGETKEG